jgi:hypothetical protein
VTPQLQRLSVDKREGRLTSHSFAPIAQHLDQDASRSLLPLAKASQIDRAEVEARLREIVSDWKDPLSGDTSQARQVLRKLLYGRLKFSPKLDDTAMPYYEFSGAGVLDPLIKGSVSGTGNGSIDRSFNDLKRWWPQRDSNPCLLSATRFLSPIG